MHKQITVTSIDESKTKAGALMWIISTLEGETYTIFEDTSPLIKGAFMMPGGSRGAVVAIDTVKKGEYENLVGAKFITKVELPDRISAADGKDLSVTLSYAVELAANKVITLEEITTWATRFYWHVTTMPKRIVAAKEGD